MDRITGHGRVDEAGSVSDYSRLEVSMRGGGPYDWMDEDDDDDDTLTVTKSGLTQKMSKYMESDEDDTSEAQDDNKTVTSSMSKSTYLTKGTKQSDTTSHDRNNHLWETETASSSGVSNPYASTVDTYYKDKNKRSGNRKGRAPTAAGLIPLAPKKDPYGFDSTGYQFQKDKPDARPPPPTWSTIDLETGKTKYVGGKKNSQKQLHSRNPFHPSNTPLAATFGTEKVKYASETSSTGLTAASLQKLGEKHDVRERTESVADYCEVADSEAGTANCPPSEPSVIASTLTRPSDMRSERDSLFVEEDEDMDEEDHIDRDVRENFLSDVDKMHDVGSGASTFEQRNKKFMSTNARPTAYVNDFGDGNVHEFKPKYEERTRKWNESGQYVGEWEGEVKKRYRRGFQEMIAARDAEMVQASKEYREWKSLSMEDRMERLNLSRQPIVLWNGRPGADDDDLHEVDDLPAIYKRRAANWKKRQKLRALLAAKARARKSKKGSQSSRSGQTVDTQDTIGRLGDLDEARANSSSGSKTPRASTSVEKRQAEQAQVQQLLLRALDPNPSGRSRSQSTRSVSSTGSSTGSRASVASTVVQPSYASSLMSGATGKSVAGSRQAPSNPPKLPRPKASGPGSIQSKSSTLNNSQSVSGNSNSTTRGQRNIPNKGAPSQDTEAQDSFAELLAFDDSPALREAVDTNVPLPALEGDALIQYNLAMENSAARGRVVTVRLHTVSEGIPRFTPGAIADRVFGGMVQEFQLHPAKRVAVVVFLHSVEARAFVQHFQNVRDKGTEQEIRELQIEVSWYKGSEAKSILAPQPSLLKHHLGGMATRCIKLQGIAMGKTHRQIFEELGQRLDKLLLSMYLITPQQHYLQESCGRQALIEFPSLNDAIEAFEDLRLGLVRDYEDVGPEFAMEGTAKQGKEKEYCGCLGCEERRQQREEVKLRKKRLAEAEYAEASTRASAKSQEGELSEEDLMEFSDESE